VSRRASSRARRAAGLLLAALLLAAVPAQNWMPQLRETFARIVCGEGAAPPGVSDLPVVEVPAHADGSDTLAFIASGDGGWASLDRQIAGVFTARGIPVVGLDTLRYYWQPRTPADSARALERILRHYLATWRKERVLLVGYSRGAGVLPFMITRLPADLRARVDVIALLGPERAIGFEFHYTDWIEPPRGDTTPLQPEIEKLRGEKILCVYGADETDSVCPHLPAGLAHLDRRPGGHHFDGDYAAIATRILAEAGR